MEDKNQAFRELHDKIEDLARRQQAFQDEIRTLQTAVFALNLSERTEVKKDAAPTAARTEVITPVVTTPPEVTSPVIKARPAIPAPLPPAPPRAVKKEKTPIEEFIGTNLLNKVGIAVLVIGIGFGAKYSIEHQLLDPLTRIILGYLQGIALIVVALRLKKKHVHFSAVLLSGGIAALYFLTYAAYDFYQLIPQAMAFALMVMFTGFTVFAALQYNQEVIGIIGLVGAYAVPFLLSDGSGRVVILFSYITIINTGILVLAFRKYWKRLYYLAFILTWLAFAAWYAFDFKALEHVAVSLIFSTIFFLTFFTTFLSYKLLRKEPLSKVDLVFMMLNSFVYYSFGYVTVEEMPHGNELLGLFTLLTAAIHFIACVIIHKQQSQFKDIFFFVAGMVLVFLTLAVPVQLEGSWVTVVWAAEAALLFWIGRTKSFPVYEKLSYPLIVLAFASLLHDWKESYHNLYFYTYESDYTSLKLFLNIQFATTLMVVAALSFVIYLGRQQRYTPALARATPGDNIFSHAVPLMVLFVLYMGIFLEIETFWNLRYVASKVAIRASDGEVYNQFDDNLRKFGTLWLICYSAIFALALAFVQLRFVKDRNVMLLSLTINAAVILAFITTGLIELSDLRASYLNDANNAYYYRGIDHILIRYLGLALVVPLLVINHRYYLRHTFFNDTLRQVETALFHTVILVLLSSELVHWLNMARIENSFKLALSILWGTYALFLIIFGLLKNLKYIRMIAIALFAITLFKLFAYDIADMSTIAKTVVMIILGVLLLTASFLYNKYKRPDAHEIQ